MTESLNEDDKSYANVLYEDYYQVNFQLFVNLICILFEKLFAFGNAADSFNSPNYSV